MSVLVTEDHPAHLAQMVAGIGGALEQVRTAYRTGEGVAYPHFGGAFRRGQAGINRPATIYAFEDDDDEGQRRRSPAMLKTRQAEQDASTGK